MTAPVYEAFGRGDVPYVLAQMAPEVEWIETEAGNIPTHGTFASPQEVLENVFAKVPEHFEQFELRPELWIEAGDDVVVTGRVVARTHAGRKLDAPHAHVFSFRDGKVTAEAVAAVQIAGAQQDPAAQNVHAIVPASR